MPIRKAHAMLVKVDGRWVGRLGGTEVAGRTKAACLARLRRIAGERVLTVEVTPALAGVAEAAAILGWDKRRVVTYVDRGSFPEPVAHLASGRVWRREDVEAFAVRWNRRRARREGRGGR
jgi:hypothetical protein